MCWTSCRSKTLMLLKKTTKKSSASARKCQTPKFHQGHPPKSNPRWFPIQLRCWWWIDKDIPGCWQPSTALLPLANSQHCYLQPWSGGSNTSELTHEDGPKPTPQGHKLTNEVYIYTYIYTYIYMYVYIYICTVAPSQTRLETLQETSKLIRVSGLAQALANVETGTAIDRTHIQIYTDICYICYVCSYVCMFVCLYVCRYVGT